MTFNEDWFSEPSQHSLAVLARSVLHLDGLYVEVGAWEGRSTVALANAINPATLHTVDTWLGSPGEISRSLAAERDVFATWRANVKELTAGNVEAHRMNWRSFFADRTDPVRFVFIDGTHTYVEVYENIVAALPLMVQGGIICGDDVHHRPVQEAVWDALGEDVYKTATLWHWTKP